MNLEHSKNSGYRKQVSGGPGVDGVAGRTGVFTTGQTQVFAQNGVFVMLTVGMASWDCLCPNLFNRALKYVSSIAHQSDLSKAVRKSRCLCLASYGNVGQIL